MDYLEYIQTMDKLSEILGDSDGQTPDEIREEFREDGFDIDGAEAEMMEFQKEISAEARTEGIDHKEVAVIGGGLSQEETALTNAVMARTDDSGILIACGGGGGGCGSGHEIAKRTRLMAELEAMLIISTVETGMPSMFENSFGRGLERSLYPAPKPSRECLLPGCQNQTRHNGGYCCADHCRAHRVIIRGRG